eukprot:scaffold20048_cov146-Isochrysis_galbana.AAC.1
MHILIVLANLRALFVPKSPYPPLYCNAQNEALAEMRQQLDKAREDAAAAKEKAGIAEQQLALQVRMGSAMAPNTSSGLLHLVGGLGVAGAGEVPGAPPPPLPTSSTPEAVQAIRREMMGLEYAANKPEAEKANAERRGRLQYDPNRAERLSSRGV